MLGVPSIIQNTHIQYFISSSFELRDTTWELNHLTYIAGHYFKFETGSLYNKIFTPVTILKIGNHFRTFITSLFFLT